MGYRSLSRARGVIKSLCHCNFPIQPPLWHEVISHCILTPPTVGFRSLGPFLLPVHGFLDPSMVFGSFYAYDIGAGGILGENTSTGGVLSQSKGVSKSAYRETCIPSNCPNEEVFVILHLWACYVKDNPKRIQKQ